MSHPPNEGSRLQAWLGLDAKTLGFGTVVTLVLATYMTVRADPPGWWPELGGSLIGVSSVDFDRDVYRHLLALVLLAGVPLAYLVGVDRQAPRDLGLGLRGAGGMFKLVAVVLVLAVPVLWLAAQRPDVARAYPRLRAATRDPGVFALYHAIYGIKWIAWEFYFRGALLLGGQRRFGTGAAVLLSTLPYTLVHLGAPMPALYGSFFFGLLLCAITLRARSIWPAVAVHWGVNVALELMLVKW